MSKQIERQLLVILMPTDDSSASEPAGVDSWPLVNIWTACCLPRASVRVRRCLQPKDLCSGLYPIGAQRPTWNRKRKGLASKWRTLILWSRCVLCGLDPSSVLRRDGRVPLRRQTTAAQARNGVSHHGYPSQCRSDGAVRGARGGRRCDWEAARHCVIRAAVCE